MKETSPFMLYISDCPCHKVEININFCVPFSTPLLHKPQILLGRVRQHQMEISCSALLHLVYQRNEVLNINRPAFSSVVFAFPSIFVSQFSLVHHHIPVLLVTLVLSFGSNPETRFHTTHECFWQFIVSLLKTLQPDLSVLLAFLSAFLLHQYLKFLYKGFFSVIQNKSW